MKSKPMQQSFQLQQCESLGSLRFAICTSAFRKDLLGQRGKVRHYEEGSGRLGQVRSGMACHGKHSMQKCAKLQSILQACTARSHGSQTRQTMHLAFNRWNSADASQMSHSQAPSPTLSSSMSSASSSASESHRSCDKSQNAWPAPCRNQVHLNVRSCQPCRRELWRALPLSFHRHPRLSCAEHSCCFAPVQWHKRKTCSDCE